MNTHYEMSNGLCACGIRCLSAERTPAHKDVTCKSCRRTKAFRGHDKVAVAIMNTDADIVKGVK